MTLRHIAIVGAGYSGTLQAIELVRRGLAVTLIERGPEAARGVAYGTDLPDHLLNVRASGMSALAGAPDHFAEWAAGVGFAPADFVPRHSYGRYLTALLAAAQVEFGDRLSLVHGDVVRIENETDIHLASGSSLTADAVILALGNLPPERPRAIPADVPDDVYVADPWARDLTAGLGPNDSVLLIGTGLTAIDAALTLDAAGFEGRIVALSRRGLLPRAHVDRPVVPLPAPEHLTPRCTDLLRSVRVRAGQVGWRGAVDALRPVTQRLWAKASVAERKRFLRHLRPWWDVHRHRIAPQIAARIEAIRRDGRLIAAAGRIVEAVAGPDGATIRWRPRAGTAEQMLIVRRIVNCTGPRSDIFRGGERLLDTLAAAGRIRPDPCRVGIDVDKECRVLAATGAPAERLFAIGPQTRGTFWEIVAIPDIRGQVRDLAERLAVSAHSGF